MTNYTYYDFAEDDYLFIKHSIDNKDSASPHNSLCSIAQKTVERYLKHLIDTKVDDNNLNQQEIIDKQKALHAYNLRIICNFLQQHLPDFQANYTYIMAIDGYYYDTAYPGSNAFFVTDNNINECWNILQYVKTEVDNYLS